MRVQSNESVDSGRCLKSHKIERDIHETSCGESTQIQLRNWSAEQGQAGDTQYFHGLLQLFEELGRKIYVAGMSAEEVSGGQPTGPTDGIVNDRDIDGIHSPVM